MGHFSLTKSFMKWSPGQGICSAKQRGQCVQLGPEDLPRPGGEVWQHQGPSTADAARPCHEGTERGSHRQV